MYRDTSAYLYTYTYTYTWCLRQGCKEEAHLSTYKLCRSIGERDLSVCLSEYPVGVPSIAISIWCWDLVWSRRSLAHSRQHNTFREVLRANLSIPSAQPKWEVSDTGGGDGDGAPDID